MNALDYDIAKEKQFSYKGLTSDEVVTHIAHFVGDLWQIHAFGEVWSSIPPQNLPNNPKKKL